MNYSNRIQKQVRIKPSGFIGNVMKLATGSAFAQGLSMIAAPIVARLFQPEAFGVAALFGSIAGIIGVIACLRYEFSIMLPETEEEAANLFAISLLSVLIIACTSGLIIVFGGDFIADKVNSQNLQKYLWLIPVAVFVNGVFLALNYWGSRTKNFGRLSIAQVISSFTTQVSKLGAGFVGFTSGGVLIVGGILGQFVSAAILGFQTWKDNQAIFKSGIKWEKMIVGLRRFRKFPMIDVWGGLLITVSWQLPSLLLAAFFSPVIVGYYALGLAVIRMPMNIMGRSIARVFYQRVSEAKNTGHTAEVVENVFKRLVAISLFPMLLLCLVGKDLFAIVFGSNWLEAGLYIQILAPFIFFNFISSPLSTIFSVYERQGSALHLNLALFLTRLISLYVGGILGNVYIALGMFSVTGVLVYGGLVMWCFKLAGISISLFFSLIFRYCLYGLPVCLGMLSLKLWLNATPIICLMFAAIATLSYEIMIVLKDPHLKNYIRFSRILRPVSQRGSI